MHPATRSKILDELLGQILVKKGLITQTQLDIALFVQNNRGNDYLGGVLRYLDVPQDRIDNVLNHLSEKRQIGEILILLGFLRPEDLENLPPGC